MGLQDVGNIAAPFCSVRQAVLPVIDVLAEDPNFDRCGRLVVRHVQKICGGKTVLKDLRREVISRLNEFAVLKIRRFKVHVSERRSIEFNVTHRTQIVRNRMY